MGASYSRKRSEVGGTVTEDMMVLLCRSAASSYQSRENILSANRRPDAPHTVQRRGGRGHAGGLIRGGGDADSSASHWLAEGGMSPSPAPSPASPSSHSSPNTLPSSPLARAGPERARKKPAVMFPPSANWWLSFSPMDPPGAKAVPREVLTPISI